MVSPFAAALNFIADFGEFAAIVPAALAVGAFLAFDGRRRLAAAWLGALALSLGTTGLLKAAHAPVSGHAAVAVAFEGGLAFLLWRDAFGIGGAARAIAVALAGLAASVGIAVWVLHWHSMLDVACGVAVGLIVPAGLACAPAGESARGRHGAVALGVVALLVALLHGVRVDDRVVHGIHLALLRAATPM